MPLIVEDDTGLVNANSYATAAEADTYFSDRGKTAWTGDTTTKEEALIRATDYIEARWAWSFKGKREFPDTPQRLSWPRLEVLDSEGRTITGVPEQVKNATMEYALKALTDSLFLEPTNDATGLTPTRVKSKVGPIEDETEYAEGDIQKTIKAFPLADRLISPFIVKRSKAIRA